MSTSLNVPYGQAGIVPAAALAAWGARLIVTQQGDVDFVADRQGTDGGEHSAELLDILNRTYGVNRLRQDIGDLLRNGSMQTRTARDFTLHSDTRLEVHANTNASVGYCYVTAWLKPDPDGTDGTADSLPQDHVGLMLEALLAVPVPDGYTSVYRERHDAVIDHIFRDVTIAPAGVEVSTFGFGTPGAYADISVTKTGDSYIVGVHATDVGYHVQSAGHVIAFSTAADAVRCAIDEIRDHLIRQERRR
jgi:hypothetical protein